MTHLALIDYGAGNLHSLKKGLEAGGARVSVTTSWKEALGRDGLVLPGVGSFGAASRGLAGGGDRVRDSLAAGLPCIGICLGMQLLFPSSEEAPGQGIGLLDGRVRRFRARIVPQMGWNDVEAVPIGDAGVADDARPGEGKVDPVLQGTGRFTAYYANSYVCELGEHERAAVIATSTYDRQEFAAGVRKGSTWGFQFHPEKSSTAGLRILANFVAEVAAVRAAR